MGRQDPPLSKMLIVGEEIGCSSEVSRTCLDAGGWSEIKMIFLDVCGHMCVLCACVMPIPPNNTIDLQAAGPGTRTLSLFLDCGFHQRCARCK